MKTRLLAVPAAVLMLMPVCCAKCGKDSETAKRQAFEVQGKTETQYREFDPKLFGSHAATREHLIGMHFIEATHRLGDFSFRQSYSYEVAGPEKTVTLKGSDEIDQLKNGDFRLSSANDSGYGIESVYAGGKYYTKSKDGSYHLHQNDRGDAGSAKQMAYGAGKSFWDLFEGRIAFADQGLTDFYGRIAHKYTASFDPSLPSNVRKDVPKASEPDAGQRPIPVGTTVPKAARGFVLVDERARTIVKTELSGDLLAGKDGEVKIGVAFKSELAPLKAGTVIREPEAAPDPRRPRIEKDPLGRLEGKKGESDKGAGGAGKKDSDDDSEGGQ